jgi:hypothetical protein
VQRTCTRTRQNKSDEHRWADVAAGRWLAANLLGSNRARASLFFASCYIALRWPALRCTDCGWIISTLIEADADGEAGGHDQGS